MSNRSYTGRAGSPGLTGGRERKQARRANRSERACGGYRRASMPEESSSVSATVSTQDFCDSVSRR